MNRRALIVSGVMGVIAGGWTPLASAQVVRIAPIVKQTPTAGGGERFSGATPPASDARIDPGSTFYVEIWATNVGAPLDGLACVYVDLTYNHTNWVDSVSPVTDSPLFPVNAVSPVFDDASGAVGDVGGCQTAPAVGMLGVGEWVLVERIEMLAVSTGNPITLSLADAANPFAGTSIIGQLNNLDPADIDFQTRMFAISECLTNGECDDSNPCTDDTCSALSCVHTPDDSNDPDDGLFCNGVDVCVGGSVQPGSPPCDDGVGCTDDICDEGTDSCTNTVNDGNCDDGLFCNGTETCDAVLDCQAGAPPCSDGVACTVDTCDDGTDSCTFTPTDSLCDDGLFCNGAETCDALAGCLAGNDPCDDGVTCTADSCDDGTDTCTNTPTNSLCDDGLFCNGSETCDALLDCQAGTDPCDDGVGCTDDSCDEGADVCTNAANNANCDDGLFCNGSETCDALLDCQAGADPCDDGVACTADSCNDGTDTCTNTPTDSLCDDGLFCNGSETCDALAGCLAGSDPCDDGITCTVDSCDDGSDTCTNTPTDSLCDDGLFCNGSETCDALLDCQAGGDPCDDGVGCTDDSCNEGTDSCTNAVNNANCDDGLFCNGAETCDALLDCQAGSDPCDDGVACTVDSCDDGSDTCTNTLTDSLCDDGLFCNGAETCDAVLGCQTGTAVNCNDGNVCTTDSCNESADACVNANNALSCNDGNSCTTGDTCSGGLCLGTPLPGCDPCVVNADCDDGNPCTNDMCHPSGVCVFSDNTNPCDDNDLCTINDVCSAGSCNGSAVDCSPFADTCNSAACNPATGSCEQSPANEGGPCDDGDVCTETDTCSSGACAGSPVDCSSQDDTCNVGVCNAGTGVCEPNPTNEGGTCDDNNVCTETDMCASGTCTGTIVPGCDVCTTAADCDDLDPCTNDACHPAGFCTHTNNTAVCNDGNPCTSGDVCSAGVCSGTPIGGCTTCTVNAECNDFDLCTTDTCVSGACSFVNTTPAGQCCSSTTGSLTTINDSNACTIDTCNGDGSVTHVDPTPADECCNPTNGTSIDIDDGNECTTDTCNANGTVTHTNSTPSSQCCAPMDGSLTPINDFDACTQDICNADGSVDHNDSTPSGQCCNPTSGNLTLIDDGVACTQDTCNPDGTVTHTNTTPSGQCCNPVNGTLTVIDDGDQCTQDTCNTNGSVAHTNVTPLGQCCAPSDGNLTPITDNDLCTIDTCNPDGTVTHSDTTPSGQCCDPFNGGLSPIDDNNDCTLDSCTVDGRVLHTNTTGPCDDGDICTINDSCSAGTCVGLVADPFCTPELNLVPSGPPSPAGGGSCFEVDDLVTVDIEMGDSTPPIIGGQFFLEYEASALQFVSMVPGDSPFSLEVFESVNHTLGTIDYAVGVPAANPGTTLPTRMATITFRVIGECDAFVRFRPHSPPTRLTDNQGLARTPDLGLPVEMQINALQTAFTNCPANIVTDADAGAFSARVQWNPITASDNCDGTLPVVCDRASNSVFPIGTTTVTCQAMNSCGAGDTCEFDVVVRPFTQMLVTIQLSPTIATSPLTRCITFELHQCGFITEEVSQEIQFINGIALEEPVEIPAGFYQCVTARDELHTLRATSADFRDDGATFSATFVGDVRFGGHGLTGGNLNDDDTIDIVDFAIYNTNIGAASVNTDCTVGRPHADINGDGVVNLFDFTFIQRNFLRGDQLDCCTPPSASSGHAPRESITVRELMRMGLGDLSAADLNHDGVVDLEDVAVYVEGAQFEKPRSDPRDERRGGVIGDR